MSIYELARESIAQLKQRGSTPSRIVFSPDGCLKAIADMDELRHFNFGQHAPPTTYMGLPFEVRCDQQELVVAEALPSSTRRRP